MSHLARLLMSSGQDDAGQFDYFRSGTVDWVVPEGVYSISVLLVASGGYGRTGEGGQICSRAEDDPYGTYTRSYGIGGGGGSGGRARYVNDLSVTPGQIIRVSIGDTSLFGGIFTSYAGGGSLSAGSADPGGRGGAGTQPWFGADGSGYSGSSGPRGNGFDMTDPLGPKVPGGPGGGGGGGGGGYGTLAAGWGACTPNPRAPGRSGTNGTAGGVRIIWPGHSRQFPSTRTQDE